MPGKAMHQTTVRFGSDLWADLVAESDRVGVSVAQFVREAAVARLAYNAGRRGDPAALGATRLQELADETAANLQSSEAVMAQGRLARDRAQQLRTDAENARTRQSSARV